MTGRGAHRISINGPLEDHASPAPFDRFVNTKDEGGFGGNEGENQKTE
jgi:hypothetical protein